MTSPRISAIGFSLLLLSSPGCASLGRKPARALPAPFSAAEPLRSFKGWELYSWQEDGEWVFAVLIGTNRSKNAGEIRKAELSGIEALQRTLEQLAPGQQIFWNMPNAAAPYSQADWGFLERPPKSIINQVKDICETRQLILRISS